MKILYLSSILCLLNFSISFSESTTITKGNRPTFNIPDGFLIGAGTSAFQSEGAWNTSGKSASYLDGFYNIDRQEYQNAYAGADVASDSYHNYKRDVEILKDIGLNVYRFSISWSRILPTGYTHTVNKEGLRHYHNLLDELERAGVEPIMQLFHFDHPLSLERIGGWKNESMVQIFADYARFIFEEFGDRVKTFITFNEPNLFCNAFQLTDNDNQNSSVPSQEQLVGTYNCVHNMLKAHAEAYHVYDKEFRAKQKGLIGMNPLCNNFYPKQTGDESTADLAFEFSCGWVVNPIFSKSGDYPEIMKKRILENSIAEGFNESRLPAFSEEWIQKIRGSADFFGLSHYQSHLAEPTGTVDPSNFFMTSDAGIKLSVDPSWPQGPDPSVAVVPRGLRDILNRLKKIYNNPTIYLIENGYKDRGDFDDQDRIDFIYSYMSETLKAVYYDNCDVKAYIYWSLIDSFEFIAGYEFRFGLVNVDVDDPGRKRTLRKSADWLREVLRRKQLFMEE